MAEHGLTPEGKQKAYSEMGQSGWFGDGGGRFKSSWGALIDVERLQRAAQPCSMTQRDLTQE